MNDAIATASLTHMFPHAGAHIRVLFSQGSTALDGFVGAFNDVCIRLDQAHRFNTLVDKPSTIIIPWSAIAYLIWLEGDDHAAQDQ